MAAMGEIGSESHPAVRVVSEEGHLAAYGIRVSTQTIKFDPAGEVESVNGSGLHLYTSSLI